MIKTHFKWLNYVLKQSPTVVKTTKYNTQQHKVKNVWHPIKNFQAYKKQDNMILP